MRMTEEMDWSNWTRLSADRAESLLTRLEIEVGVEHRLADIIGELEVFAADSASDDILVSDPADADLAYIVHLTWSQTPEQDVRLPWVTSVSRASVPQELS